MLSSKQFNELRARMLRPADIPAAAPGLSAARPLYELLKQIVERIEALKKAAAKSVPPGLLQKNDTDGA